VLFGEIYEEFTALASTGGDFQTAGLFAKIQRLEQKLIFDIKEKAHFLFRSANNHVPKADGSDPEFADLERVLAEDRYSDRNRAREIFSQLRKSLVRKSIDSYMGTGFHLFLILMESVYQLEYYVPQYRSETEYLEQVETLTERIGYRFNEEEEHELNHIRNVVRLCRSIADDTYSLAVTALERCMTLFRETAAILHHAVEESASNEVLVLNLLKEKQLVERVYGTGSWEHLLDLMFRTRGGKGESGVKKAEAFVRATCGNVESLDD